MATVNVGLSDTFETWRTKTNEIGTAVGDVAQLDSSFSTSDVVSAINETRTDSAIYSPLNIINGGTITTTAGEFVFQVNAQDQLTIDSNGDLTATRNLIATGNVTTKGTISDIRLKENIVRLNNSLEKISQINGYTFNYKDRPDETMPGVIAQEIEKVLPEVVYDFEQENETYKAVRYANIVPLLIEAIKDLKGKVDELETQINKG